MPVALPKRRPGPAKPRVSIPREEWPTVLRRIEQGETLRDVAKVYNTSYETVRRILKTLRSPQGFLRSPQRLQSPQSGAAP